MAFDGRCESLASRVVKRFVCEDGAVALNAQAQRLVIESKSQAREARRVHQHDEVALRAPRIVVRSGPVEPQSQHAVTGNPSTRQHVERLAFLAGKPLYRKAEQASDAHGQTPLGSIWRGRPRLQSKRTLKPPRCGGNATHTRSSPAPMAPQLTNTVSSFGCGGILIARAFTGPLATTVPACAVPLGMMISVPGLKSFRSLPTQRLI
jgi:hypothetical protein